MPAYNAQVFLNVPFDTRYKKLFHALVFAVQDCGLVARCAMERDDGGEIRLSKIFDIIEQSRYGIHDLSRTTLDAAHRLPRFNMPLELGVFLGARQFGSSEQRRKCCLILDRDRYRYQVFCSDIAGQDIRAHGNEVADALTAVRNWLQANVAGHHRLPGPSQLQRRYVEFRSQLPIMCRLEGLHVGELTFLDYRTLIEGWLDENPQARPA